MNVQSNCIFKLISFQFLMLEYLALEFQIDLDLLDYLMVIVKNFIPLLNFNMLSLTIFFIHVIRFFLRLMQLFFTICNY